MTCHKTNQSNKKSFFGIYNVLWEDDICNFCQNSWWISNIYRHGSTLIIISWYFKLIMWPTLMHCEENLYQTEKNNIISKLVWYYSELPA